MLKQRKSMKKLSPEEEGVAETTTAAETDLNPRSLSHGAAVGEEVENSGVKLCPERREDWEEGVFKV